MPDSADRGGADGGGADGGGGGAPGDTSGESNEAEQASDRWAESYYNSAWTAVMDAVIGAGGAISHHHGIGINRSRFVSPSIGGGARSVSYTHLDVYKRQLHHVRSIRPAH